MDIRDVLITIMMNMIFFSICYGVTLVVIIAIQHSWISFFEYGWIWNNETMPPLVWWSIVFRVLPLSALLSIIISPIIYVIIIIIFYHYR